MKLSIVVGISRNGVIGRNGGLPWRLPADLRNFKQLTMGKPIVMGRRTYDSIGRVLPGRENIVLSRDKNFRAEGCTVLDDLAQVQEQCRGHEQVMIIGGRSLYAAALPLAAKLYLTEVHAEVEGGICFPDFDRAMWRETERRDFRADEENEYDYSFVVLERAL